MILSGRGCLALAGLIVMAASLAMAPRRAQAAVLQDDTGQTVTLAAPARRVVTLAPNLTELVWAVGGGERLVGTVDTSDFPAAARSVPRIGNHQHLDIERLVLLKPDLILVWRGGTPASELDQLRRAGLTLYFLEPRRLDDVPRALERTAALMGLDGRPAAEALRARLEALRRQQAGRTPVDVYYQVWSRPLMTLSGGHLVSDLIALCGGRNVFGHLAPLVPQLSTESVVAADPELMMASHDGNPQAGDGQLRRTPATQEPAWAAFASVRSMRAVRRGWLYTVPGDLINRAGPRIADGAALVCRALDEVRRERGR